MLYMRVGHRPVLAKHFQKRRVGITAGTHEKITSVRFQGDSDKITTYGFLDLEKFSLRRNSHTVEKNSITQKIFDDRISKKNSITQNSGLRKFFLRRNSHTVEKNSITQKNSITRKNSITQKKFGDRIFFRRNSHTVEKNSITRKNSITKKKFGDRIFFFGLICLDPHAACDKIYKSRVGHLSPVFKNQWAVESSLQLFPYIYEGVRFGTYYIMLSLSKNAWSEFPHGDSYVVKFQSPGQCTSRP